MPRNTQGFRPRVDGGWLQVDLRSSGENAFGIGALLELEGGEYVQLRESRTASSFASQNDLTVHFGIGGLERVPRLLVHWPGGRKQALEELPARRTVLLFEPGPGLD